MLAKVALYAVIQTLKYLITVLKIIVVFLRKQVA